MYGSRARAASTCHFACGSYPRASAWPPARGGGRAHQAWQRTRVGAVEDVGPQGARAPEALTLLDRASLLHSCDRSARASSGDRSVRRAVLEQNPQRPQLQAGRGVWARAGVDPSELEALGLAPKVEQHATHNSLWDRDWVYTRSSRDGRQRERGSGLAQHCTAAVQFPCAQANPATLHKNQPAAARGAELCDARDMEAGFLQERLAAAAALPLERRTPEVNAFLEVCQLNQDLVDALDLPEGGRTRTIDEQWTCARALKLARAKFVGESRLIPNPELCQYSITQLRVLCERDAPAALSAAGDVSGAIMALLQRDAGLATVAKMAAALPDVSMERFCWSALHQRLRAANADVELLRQPAVRQRLEHEAQQEGILTYEEILAIFVSYAAQVSGQLQPKALRDAGAIPASSMAGIQGAILEAYVSATELLPRLAPNRPRFLMEASEAAVPSSTPHTLAHSSALLTRAFHLAEQQGNNFYVASCSYRLSLAAVMSHAIGQPAACPSAALAWLQHAEAAHARCRGVCTFPRRGPRS